MPMKTFYLLLVLLLSLSTATIAHSATKNGQPLTNSEKEKFTAICDKISQQKMPMRFHVVILPTITESQNPPTVKKEEIWAEPQRYIYRHEHSEGEPAVLNHSTACDGKFWYSWLDSANDKLRYVEKSGGVYNDYSRVFVEGPNPIFHFMIKDIVTHSNYLQYNLEPITEVDWNGGKAIRITQKKNGSTDETFWILDPLQNYQLVYFSSKTHYDTSSYTILKMDKTSHGIEYAQHWTSTFTCHQPEKPEIDRDVTVSLFEPLDNLPEGFPNIPPDVVKSKIGKSQYPIPGNTKDAIDIDHIKVN